jgi:hypothetical protein
MNGGRSDDVIHHDHDQFTRAASHKKDLKAERVDPQDETTKSWQQNNGASYPQVPKGDEIGNNSVDLRKQVLAPSKPHALTKPLTAFLSFPIPRELLSWLFCRSSSMCVGALKFPLNLLIWWADEGEE